VTKQAPSGNPPPIPLAIEQMSGTIPDFSNAKILPVRQKFALHLKLKVYHAHHITFLIL
jgi:hypothetical protein